MRVLGSLALQTADTQAPTTPTGFVATVISAGRVDLSWSASTDNVGVAGYQVWRNGVPRDTTAVTTYSDSTSPSTTYTYTVSAFDAAGNSSGLAVNQQVTTQANAAPIWTNPGTQSLIVGNSFSLNLATYVSDAESDALNFAITSGTLPTGITRSGSLLSGTPTVAGESQSVTFSAADQFHTVTQTISFITYSVDVTAPPVPTGVGASAAGSAQINVTWNASTDVAGSGSEFVSGTKDYRVYRSTDGTNYSLRTTVTVPSYSDSGLGASTQYFYKIAVRDNALNESAQSSAINATTAASSSFETTFDALYAPGFLLISDTTYYAKPAQTKPASKAASLSSPSYTDQRFNTKIFRATNVADADSGQYYLRHEYSRRQAWNCDNTYFIAEATNGFWYLYDGSTFARLNGGRTATPGLGGLGVGTGGQFGGDCEPIWHPTNPNRIWYMDTNGGMAVYEFDIVTKTRTTYINWAPIIAALGASWSTVTRVWWQGEGRPSNDGDVWGMSAQTSGFNQVGFFMYRKSTNTVLGSILTTNKPNNVSTSPSGAYCVPSWSNGSGQSMTAAAAAPINTTDGTRAYTADFSSFRQLSYYGEHADTATDALGNDVYVSINYNVGNMPDVPDGYLYYRRMDNGVAYSLTPGYTGTSFAWHMSGHGIDRPGWVIAESYAGGNGSAWKDEVVMAIKLETSNPKRLRLAHHQSLNNDYWAEPHATCNRGITRVMFASNFGATNNESYMIGLGSGAVT